ncbi:MAG: hypothetical protein R3B47_11240 [Bacteroidia bacterium]
MTDEDQRRRCLSVVAYTMKQLLRGNDKDSMPPEEILANHINEISQGKLNITADDLDLPRNVRMRAQPSNLVHHTSRQKKRSKKKTKSKSKSTGGNNSSSGGSGSSSNNRRRRRR